MVEITKYFDQFYHDRINVLVLVASTLDYFSKKYVRKLPAFLVQHY